MAKRKPRPHQKEAIIASTKHFKKHHKGRLIMACGTGKTLTSLWIAEMLKAKRILITVPSLSLSAQNLDQWQNEYESIGKQTEFLCVCSDKTVGYLKDEKGKVITRIPVTTDVKQIRKIANKKNFIIITTYSSADAVIHALKSIEFDLSIYDEAHKTAGADGKLFSKLILDKNITAKKKLFMTATERIYSGNLQEVVSMDDVQTYGEKFYELQFREAINRGILCDYTIKLVHTSSPDIRKWLNKNPKIKDSVAGLDDHMRSVAAAIILSNELNSGSVHRCISYHNTVANAQTFSETLGLISKSLGHELKSFHVNGTMSAGLRRDILKAFAANKNVVMTNSRALTEGIDIPNLDGIAFIDKRNSVIDIAQALGRAIRMDKTRPGKKATVYIPIAEETTKGYAAILKILKDLVLVDHKIDAVIRKNDYVTLGEMISDDHTSKVRVNLKKLLTSVEARTIMYNVMAPTFSVVYDYCHQHNITSFKDYMALHKQSRLPIGFPQQLASVYKKEYTNSDLFKVREWAPYSEVQAFIKANNIESLQQYDTMWADGKLPKNFPKTIFVIYAGKIQHEKLFATRAKGSMEWASDEEIIKMCRKHKVFTVKAYNDLRVNGILPKNKFPGKGTVDSQLFIKLESEHWLAMETVLAKFCKKNKITTLRAYVDAWNEGTLPAGAPKALEVNRFMRIRNIIPTYNSRVESKASLETMATFMKKNKIDTVAKYDDWQSKGKLPKDFPVIINNRDSRYLTYFRNNGVLTLARTMRIGGYERFKQVVQQMKIVDNVQYKKMHRAGRLPKDMPAAPLIKYGELYYKDIYANKIKVWYQPK